MITHIECSYGNVLWPFIRITHLESSNSRSFECENSCLPSHRSNWFKHKKDAQADYLRPRRKHGHLRSEEHTSELQSRVDLVCRLLLEKKKKKKLRNHI